MSEPAPRSPLRPRLRYSPRCGSPRSQVRTAPPSTLLAYRDRLDRQVIPALGSLRVRELSTGMVDRHLRAVRDKHGASMAKLCRTVLSGMAGLATRLDALEHNPVRDAGRIVPSKPKRVPRALSVAARPRGPARRGGLRVARRPRPRRHRRRRGTALATRRGGELSLAIDRWRLLAKSLRPPPDKFHGLEDVETRYRQRELDLIANEESRRALRASAPGRSAEIRRWLDEHGFVEVETPVLQPLYGGALARPFTTHHNALDRDFYLRIATELYLKRLVVGGIDRVYELGKDFRNEGVSHKHNPEFTMLEWYEAYADYEKTAHDLEQLVAEVAERVLGTTMVERDGVEIDLAPPWKRVTLREAIRERDRHRHRRAPDPRGAGRGDGREPDPSRGLGQAGRRAALQVGRAGAGPADLRRSTTRSSSRRSPRRTAPRRAWSSAGRPSSAGSRSPTPSASSTTPTSSAAASSSRPRSWSGATRRRSPTTRLSSRRSSRGCRRPAASGSGSTAW